MAILKDFPQFNKVDNLLYPIDSGSIIADAVNQVVKTLDVNEIWLVRCFSLRSTGALSIKIEDDQRDGRNWFSDIFISKDNLAVGNGAYRVNLDEYIIVHPGAQIVASFQDDSSSANDASILLIGKKLKK